MGENQEEVLERDPGFKPVGIKSDPQPTLPCFPHSQGGRDSDVGRWWVKSGRHSQSFASEVWDEGQLTDFQELRLQRKKKAQRRDSLSVPQILPTLVLCPQSISRDRVSAPDLTMAW